LGLLARIGRKMEIAIMAGLFAEWNMNIDARHVRQK